MSAPILPTTAAPNNWLSDSTANTTLEGNVNDYNQLAANASDITLVGASPGNNTYIVYDPSDAIVQVAGIGANTVETWGSGYTLPQNVQNLTLEGSSNARGTGNGGNNLIIANSGTDTLTTGGGNDVLVAGSGADTFVPTAQDGSATWIENFKTSGSVTDKLDLYGFGFQGFSELQSAMTQVGADTEINLGRGQTVWLANTTASSITASDVQVEADPTLGMHLTFDDEFNGPLTFGNATVNTGSNTWNTTYNGGVRTLAGNNEQEIYVDPNYAGSSSSALGLNPFSASNGVLNIQAAQTPSTDLSALGGFQYTSGVMTTQSSFSQTYGYFEIRAEVPSGQGLWPAFWMLPESNTWPPELDVFEQIGSNNTYVSNGVGSKLTGSVSHHGTYVDANTSTGFHTYGMSWTASTISFYFDGQETYQVATPADVDTPMYMIMNLAVGGSWPGSPDATTNWAQAGMKVDWVRAYSYDPTSVAAPTVTLSNAMSATDLSSSFTAAATGVGTSTTYSAGQLGISGVSGTTVTVAYDANNDLTVTNNGAWNAIKNATIKTTTNGEVAANNFVDTEISLGNGDSAVTVTGVKRGTIAVGNGDDHIAVSAFSNGTTQNVLTITAGDGNNQIGFSGASNTATAIRAGNGNNTVTIGNAAAATVSAGGGNNDFIDNSTGSVTESAGGGTNTFEFLAGAHATVNNFNASLDSIVLHGATASQVTVATSGSSSTITVAGSSTSVLHINGAALSATSSHLVYA